MLVTLALMNSPAVVIYASISDIPQPSYAPGGKKIVGIQCAGRGLAHRHDSFTQSNVLHRGPCALRYIPLVLHPVQDRGP